MQEESALRRFLYPDKKTRYGIHVFLWVMCIALLAKDYYRSKPLDYPVWTILSQPPEGGQAPEQKAKIRVLAAAPEQWQQLGLSNKQSALLITFLRKKQPRDYHALRVFKYVPEGFWENQKHLLLFDSIPAKDPAAKAGSTMRARLDLNAAKRWQLEQTGCFDTLALKQFFILRKRLGGFSDPHQVFELDAVDSGCVAGRIQEFYTDTVRIRKIRINHTNISELQRHPYLNRGLAGALINYRDNHGAYTCANDLLLCYGMNENLLKKLRPYLSFDL